MDGDQTAPLYATDIPARAPPKTLRWLTIVGLLLVLLLAGLYGFERFREHAIQQFFAHNVPPPAAVSAVVARVAPVPHQALGIGSLAVVHQVTISPEIGGRVVKLFFQSGQRVKAGDPLLQINDEPERGDLANYQAQARLATVSLKRASTLSTKQFESQATVDQDQAQLDQANAQIAKTQALIAQKLVRAPFAGRLGLRQVDLGQYLSPGAAIVTLTDLAELHVDFTLPSSLRPEIAVGQKVEVTADAYPGRTFKAEITAIEPQVSASTRTMQVEATMPNPDEALLPGMFVNAAVILPAKPDTVVLPETALDFTLYGDSVYVVRETGRDAQGKPILTAVRTPVTTGARWGDKVAIVDGVKPGDQVVAAGQIKLRDGARVVVTGAPPPQPPAHPTMH
jgi:membrane fusion protein, multidrug efflux system